METLYRTCMILREIKYNYIPNPLYSTITYVHGLLERSMEYTLP